MNKAGSTLHLAFFIPDLSGGGLERMRLVLAAELRARGHRVTLIVRRASGQLKEGLPPGVEFIELGRWRSLQCLAKMWVTLRRLRPDVVLASTPHNALVATFTAWGTGIKVLAVQHNMLSIEAAAVGGSHRMMPMLFRVLSPLWAGTLAVSYGVADDLVRCGVAPDRISVVPNPAMPAAAAIVTDSSKQETSAGQRLFVFIGRLVAQKNPALALDAFARTAARGGRLVFLGDGPLRQELAAMAASLGVSSQVEFPGFVPDVLPMLRAASALVMTSDYEGFRNVIVEALAVGTPVVASDCPSGPREILDDGRYGCLFPPGDVVACAALMGEDLRARFPAEMLRARAAEFSAPRAADAVLVEARRAVRPAVGGPLSLPFTDLSPAQLAARCFNGKPKRFRYVVTVNASHLRHMRRRLMAAACINADILTADGAPVGWLRRLFGAAVRPRLTGCALTAAVATQIPCGGRIVVVVEGQATAEALRAWAVETRTTAEWVPVVAPAGLRDSFLRQHSLVQEIQRLQPDILLLTLGAPVSEEFCFRYREVLPPCWGACVGQAVRVLIGATPRAPAAWRRHGLEWLWRVQQEPRRLAIRYAQDAIWLPVSVLRDLTRARRAAPPG